MQSVFWVNKMLIKHESVVICVLKNMIAFGIHKSLPVANSYLDYLSLLVLTKSTNIHIKTKRGFKMLLLSDDVSSPFQR